MKYVNSENLLESLIQKKSINKTIVNFAVRIAPADGLRPLGAKTLAGLILGLHPANKRRRYKETPSVIGWAQT